jgi:hypothetical protein
MNAPILLVKGGDTPLKLTFEQFDEQGRLVGPLDLTDCIIDITSNTLPFTPVVTITNAEAGEVTCLVTDEQADPLPRGQTYTCKFRVIDSAGLKHPYPAVFWETRP